MPRKYLIVSIILILVGTLGITIGTFGTRQINGYDDVLQVLDNYLEVLDNPDLAIGEIMEFEQHYYAVIFESSTEIGAFELLVDKNTGQISNEPGPNMMWNTKYGHHRTNMMSHPEEGPMTVFENQSVLLAQQYLDENIPNTTATDPHPFYGYYTLHIEREEQIIGMLSINGYTQESWYHNWHGEFIQSWEMHE